MGYIDFPHGGNIYEVERRYKRKVIDFSANINPLGLPQEVKRAIYKNFNSILHYPDSNPRIISKIASYWGVDENNLLLGNGSAEFIYLIISTFKPRTALIPMPTFSEYERAVKNIKSKIRFLKLQEKENFGLKVSFFDKADIFFLCNPNNPTGNLLLEDRKKVEQMTGSKLLVIDEAFMDFLPNQRDYTLVWKAVRDRKIIVLRTFTKFFALPGLRIGYLIAHNEIVDRLKQCQPPWSINSLAQLAAATILSDKRYIKRTYKVIEKERQFLFRQLKRIDGLNPYPSVTNFLLIKIENPDITTKSLKELLVKKGILIRDCANFRGLTDKFIRIAVRSRKENLLLLTALRETI